MALETHANRAYQHLRGKLLAGDFEPGARLLYGPIGKEIGVSATPIREAAGLLAQEGLVDLVPNMGAIVRTLDRKDLIEIYEVREVIEPSTAALAAQRITSEQLAGVSDQLEQMRSLTAKHKESQQQFAGKRIAKLFDSADYLFHMLIIEATGNQALVRTASQSHVLTRVFGIRRHRHDVEAMQRTCREHESIFKGLRNGEPEEARAASIQHIQHGLAVSLLALDEYVQSQVTG